MSDPCGVDVAGNPKRGRKQGRRAEVAVPLRLSHSRLLCLPQRREAHSLFFRPYPPLRKYDRNLIYRLQVFKASLLYNGVFRTQSAY